MRLAIISLLALAACSSATTSGRTERTQTIRAEGMGSLTIAPTNPAVVTSVAASMEDVWLALPTVYDTLGIPKARIDVKKHEISSQGMKIRQRLGRTPLSRYIDCGNTQIGSNADSYEVFMTITTSVDSVAQGTARLSTLVEAAARPLSFNQDYSRCSSRGLLESRIADAVKARLAK
jgi:hypothetical protein